MNHGDAVPLAAGGIVPAPCFLSCRARVISKENHPTNCFFLSRHLCLGVVGCLLPCFLGFGPLPPSWLSSPPSKFDGPRVALLFLHQALIVQQLIVVLGPNFRVSSSPVRSSQLSCRCRSMQLHRPSRNYLREVPSQSH